MDMFPFLLWMCVQGLFQESTAYPNWCQIEFPEYLAPIWWDPAQHLHFHMEISILALTEESVSGKLFGVDLEYERKTLQFRYEKFSMMGNSPLPGSHKVGKIQG